MKELAIVAAKVQAALDAAGIPNCVIGGLAVARWGEARLTKDVDLAALSGIGGETRVIDCVLRVCHGRVSDPRAFALRHRTLVVESGRVPVDVSLAALPFEARMMQRASSAEYAEGVILRTASAEDLVVMKVFAGRPRDLEDVRGIAVRQGSRLDRRLVRTELLELSTLAERTDLLPSFDQVLARADG
jgi:hypothetical protein